MKNLLLVLLAATAGGNAAEKMNAVIIMADDIGFECYSSYGSEYYRTPNIDRLAATGARFTQAYANPICTPSRAKIVTGRYNFRNYTRFGNLDLSQPTFAKLARDTGYRTAVAGKWQLSPNNLDGPGQAGFDEYCLWHFAGYGVDAPREAEFKDKGSRFKSPRLYRDGKRVPDTEGRYGPDLVSDFLCDFIHRNREQPFVAYYPMILVHSPFVPTPDSPDWEKTDKRRKPLEHFRDMVHYMDKVIGKIVKQLEASGVRESTLVIVTGDNGTHTRLVSPFPGRGTIRGGKGSTRDAGTRVAFVANWPGVIAPGTVIDAPVDFTDILPTVADLAGVPPPAGSDGQSLVPLLRGDLDKARDWLFVSYNRNTGKGPFQCFVRDADWKLYANGNLFHVPRDWDEKNPVGKEGAAARQRLQPILDRILADAKPGLIAMDKSKPGAKKNKKR